MKESRGGMETDGERLERAERWPCVIWPGGRESSGHFSNGKSDESSKRVREEENDEAHFHLTHFRWWPDLVCNANYGHVGDLDTLSDTGRWRTAATFETREPRACRRLLLQLFDVPPPTETDWRGSTPNLQLFGRFHFVTLVDFDLVHLVGTDVSFATLLVYSNHILVFYSSTSHDNISNYFRLAENRMKEAICLQVSYLELPHGQEHYPDICIYIQVRSTTSLTALFHKCE